MAGLPTLVPARERHRYEALFVLEHLLGGHRFTRYFGAARESLRRQLAEVLASQPRDVRLPVPEVEFTNHAEFLRRYRPPCLPVVFRGLARDWQACREWSLDYFGEHYGSTPAVMVEQPGLAGPNEVGRFEVTTVGRIVDDIRAGLTTYLRFSPLMAENPELLEAFDVEWLRAFRPRLSLREAPQFFLGPASTYTPLHCALTVNLFVQVSGRKRWILYPAKQQALVEPVCDRRPYFHSSFHPERSAPGFDLAPFATAYEVTLEPGDVLYNPPLVWHTVENLTPTISVGYRFYDLRQGWRSSWLMTLLTFLAPRPSLVQSLYYSITKTNFLHRPPTDM